MKRPLIAVALFYVVGVLLADLPVPLVQLFIVAFALAILFLVWPSARRVSLAGLILIAGWINCAQRNAILAPDDLRVRMVRAEESATVRGILRETPRLHAHEGKRREITNSLASLEITAIQINGTNWRSAHGIVMTTTEDALPAKFFAGQTVEIDGVLRKPSGPLAEGLFDYRYYLQQQGIYFQLDAINANAWHLLDSPARPPLADRFRNWAKQALAMGLPVQDEPLHLEWALTLGYKTALTDEVSEPFVKASTYHIFAVDGLRIAIVTGIIFTLLRVLRVPRAWCGIVTIPFLLLYAGLTGWPASAIRAIVMIVVVFGGWALNRPSDLLNSLFAAALVILVWEPRQLFQAGFQLSFFVVLCIILILPFFRPISAAVLRPNPLLPESLEPRWKKWLRDPVRWAVDLFLASVAAWLGSIPLVAYYFHLITPLSGPSNLLAVPLCMLVLICNLTSLLCAAWLPFVSVIYNHAGWFLMDCILVTSKWSAHWPAAYYYVPTPGWFTMGLYYLVLIGALTGWLFRGRRVMKLSAVVALLAVWCGMWIHDRSATKLTVLPLDDGHAVYLNEPNGRGDWLLDCGNDSSVQSVMKPFLQAHGVNRLDNFILTHGEIGYSGGADLTCELFPPRKIYLSAIHFRSPTYRQFRRGATNEPAFRNPLQTGDKIGHWTVLYPPDKSSLTKGEDNALVLRGEFSGTKVLLLSDLSHAGQNALLASNPDIRADVIIAGIPSGGEPFIDALLDAAKPKVIIVADSRQPAAKRAGTQLRQRLLSRGVPVVYTSDADAATVEMRPEGWKISAMNGANMSFQRAIP